MSKFTANFSLSKKIIDIESDTFWSCHCSGDLMLSKYSGIGDDTIDVIEVDDLLEYNGSVYFTYGDEKCEMYELKIYYANKCIIKTVPKYTVCINDDGTTRNVLHLNYNYDNEVIEIEINTLGEYTIDAYMDFIYFQEDNKIRFIPGENVGDIIIKPNKCDTSDWIYIKLTKLN